MVRSASTSASSLVPALTSRLTWASPWALPHRHHIDVGIGVNVLFGVEKATGLYMDVDHNLYIGKRIVICVPALVIFPLTRTRTLRRTLTLTMTSAIGMTRWTSDSLSLALGHNAVGHIPYTFDIKQKCTLYVRH